MFTWKNIRASGFTLTDIISTSRFTLVSSVTTNKFT